MTCQLCKQRYPKIDGAHYDKGGFLPCEDEVMHNPDEAQRQQEELTRYAQRDEIRKVLQGCKVPVTVAYIVKQTGLNAYNVRDIVLDMVAEGEVKERLWCYSL